MNDRDEETLRNLPQILEGIVLLDRLERPNLERPNPLAGKDIAVEGGPLNGSTQHNDGSCWLGDNWDVEVADVRHRYRLGARIRPGDTTHLWFYKGHLDPAGALVEPDRTAVPDADRITQHSSRPARPHTSPEGSR